MRLLLSAALLAATLCVLTGHAVRSSFPDPGPGSSVELASASGGRQAGTNLTAPSWFGGKWWKKFRRAMKRFLDFIDALIDDLRNQPGDQPGGGEPGPGGIAFVRPVTAPLLA